MAAKSTNERRDGPTGRRAHGVTGGGSGGEHPSCLEQLDDRLALGAEEATELVGGPIGVIGLDGGATAATPRC